MSAFHRFIFSTFLFLALSCFGASSAFATTYTYYKSNINNQFVCGLSSSSICGQYFSWVSSVGALASAAKVENKGCYGDTTIGIRINVFEYSRIENGTTIYYGSYDASGSNIATKQTHTCAAGEKFELIGCTAQCVPDPCAALKDQEFSGLGVCGSFSCSDGGVVQNGSCSKGQMTQSTGQAPQSMIDTNQCIGTFDRPNLTQKFYNKGDDEGKSSGAAYCSAFYKYTGLSSNNTVEDLNLFLLSAFSAVPMPENGVCPPDKPQPSTIDGQQVCIPNTLPDDDNCPVDGEKQNSNGVCVGPDDPTYPKDGEDPNKDPDENTPNTCPKGQIKNNSGVCVPYGDATNCPVGQVRSNLGTCITDPKANSCPSGQIKNLAGACVPNPKGTGCSDGSTPNANGVCANGVGACPVGQTRNASGVCVTTSPSSGCKDGSTPNASGICSDGSGACPVGKIRNASGVCVSDPDDPDSSKSASLASNCETAPECDGDPIQCAMYHHQWKSNCEAIRAPDENEKAQIRGAIEDTNNQIDGRENEYKDAVNAIIADSGLLNNPVPTTAQCIPDKTINIMSGVSVTVPYSLLCPYFSLLRSMLIMVAYLFAARIIYAELTGGGIRV